MTVQSCLCPGDCLLYESRGLIGLVIRIKTWHRATHCEVYVGGGETVASRGPQDGTGGVGRYSLREDGLAHILRPVLPFDMDTALRWFATVDGQRYDLWGLLRFFTIGHGKQDRMFCSEFATRFYRAGGLEPFQADEDADLIAPGTFLVSPIFAHYRVTGCQVTPAHLIT